LSSEQQNTAKQAIFRRDLHEINKIEIIDENTDAGLKKRVLGSSVPLFLIKVSKSYYQRIEQYTK
jgi:hypothetical protein